MTVIKVASPGRRRVLLFDGNDQAVATAAPALAGIGIDLVHLSSIDDDSVSLVASSVPDALAVVVAPPRAREDAATAALVRTLREVNALPVLLLARRMQDDVLLQEIQPATGGLTTQLVPLELAQQIRAILRRAPTRVLRFGLLEIDTGSREVRVDDQVVELSRREFDLVVFLAFVARSSLHAARAARRCVAFVGRVANRVDGHRARAPGPDQAARPTRPAQLARHRARHGLPLPALIQEFAGEPSR